MFTATRQYIQMITSALATQTNVKIYESDKWAVDAKSKTLFYDSQSLKTLPFYVIKGVLLHEVSHLLHTEDPVFREDYVERWGRNVLMNVYNPFEDFRIEKKMVDRFGSYAEDAFCAALIHLIEKNLEMEFSELPKIDQFLLLSFLTYIERYDIHGSESEISRLMSYAYGWSSLEDFVGGPGYQRAVDQEVFDRFTKHHTHIFDIFEKSRKSASTQELVDRIDTDLIPLIEDFLDQDKEKRDQEGDGEGKGEGEEDAQGQGQKSMQSMSSLAQKGSKESDKKSQAFGSGPTEDRQYIQKSTEHEVTAILKPYINTLSQRLQSILQEKAHTKWRGSHLSGKLLNKSAYKVTIPGETRMFSKKTTPDTPHYHIYLALDASGSMNEHTKGVYTYMGAVMLKAVCNSLKFNIDIVQYDDNAAMVGDLYNDYSYNGGGTDDFSALRLIEKKIKPEENNLIFFLTDGDTNIQPERQELIARLENKFNAYIFGVGIGQSIRHEKIIQNYKRGIQVDQVHELPQRLVEVIRSVIKR